MIRTRCVFACSTVLACANSAACASSSNIPPKEPATSSPVATAAPPGNVAPDARAEPENRFTRVPTTCAEQQADGVCTPPKPFVTWMCGTYPRPDVALIVFRKATPFTRVYLNRNVEAWYTSGQQSTSAKLLFDEEVIVVSHHQASSAGMVVGQGRTPYDVLRIDGVCSTVEPELVSFKRPPAPKHANIPWQQLDKGVREVLSHDASVGKAEGARRRACKGTTTLGVIGPECAKADDRLSAAIAAYIVAGGESPMPASP